MDLWRRKFSVLHPLNLTARRTFSFAIKRKWNFLSGCYGKWKANNLFVDGKFMGGGGRTLHRKLIAQTNSRKTLGRWDGKLSWKYLNRENGKCLYGKSINNRASLTEGVSTRAFFEMSCNQFLAFKTFICMTEPGNLIWLRHFWSEKVKREVYQSDCK